MTWRDGTEHAVDAGFTLPEVLVTLALIGIALSLVMPRLGSMPAEMQLQMASSELATALIATRSAAIMRQTSTALVINVDKRTFGSEVVPWRQFASTITATLTFAAETTSAATHGGFRFFPDGSATGGAIELVLGEKKARICVDWLTGLVSRRSKCS